MAPGCNICFDECLLSTSMSCTQSSIWYMIGKFTGSDKHGIQDSGCEGSGEVGKEGMGLGEAHSRFQLFFKKLGGGYIVIGFIILYISIEHLIIKGEKSRKEPQIQKKSNKKQHSVRAICIFIYPGNYFISVASHRAWSRVRDE